MKWISNYYELGNLDMTWLRIPPYLDSAEITGLKMIGKLRSVQLKELKRHLQARETEKKCPKYCTNVVEELAVNISSCRPTRSVFNLL